eukprot:1381406-Amorphochlora_amoeboformis.AAC.1
MESEWVDGVWGGELPTVVENKDSRASRPSSPVPSKEATLRIEGLRERMRKRARKSSAAAVDVRPLQAANLLGKQGMGLSETRNTPLDEEKLDALVPTLSSKRVCLIGQTLKNDNPENQNGDIKGLVRLKEIDLQLEGLQTCHRCGKRGKQVCGSALSSEGRDLLLLFSSARYPLITSNTHTHTHNKAHLYQQVLHVHGTERIRSCAAAVLEYLSTAKRFNDMSAVDA